MIDDLDEKIASIEAETGLDLPGDEAPSASPPPDAADALAGSAAQLVADSHLQGETAAGILREFLDERDRRIELERKVRKAEARQPPQPAPYQPDPFVDAVGFANAKIHEQLAPIRQHLWQQAVRGQISNARAAHGAISATEAHRQRTSIPAASRPQAALMALVPQATTWPPSNREYQNPQ